MSVEAMTPPNPESQTPSPEAIALQYYGRPADEVASQVFGPNGTNAGKFYSLTGENIPNTVECDGEGNVTTENLYFNEAGEKKITPGAQGSVISPEDAEQLLDEWRATHLRPEAT